MLDIFSEGEGAVHTSDGARIFYRTVGQGATTLLFLHGWGVHGTGSFWSPVLRNLDPANLRSVLVDLRGHGRSEHTAEGFSTERFAQDLFEVAEHLGAREFVVVAYSMSGRWAQWMACAQPERVLGEILIGPAPASPMPLPPGLADEWLRNIATREGYHRFENQFTRDSLAPEVLDDCFDSIGMTPAHTLRETLRMCTMPGFAEDLAGVRIPTLVIGGTHDPMMAPDYLRQEVVNKIPGARLALLDCGHNPPLEKPLETAALIEDFVALLPRARSAS